ncbi:hypothetical protein ALC57_07906 [Trachymyrmex cornetzi]|uniref:CCHC-type domain-containing protein n=1 Tax=Trachymyrmex cornetzi TaxID=471704 RepID=A0A151J7E7_9HYME|nr:hypothetical protein ALC57_07906 [Trachymyrmex cornetzi]
MKCPLKAAIKITSTPRVLIDWTVVRTELLPDRGMQCHRCWERGHVANECRSDVSRAGLCYRCGGTGHLANGCEKRAHCCVCADRGAPADHCYGGGACNPPPLRGKRRANRLDGTNPAEPARASLRASPTVPTAMDVEVTPGEVERATAPATNEQISAPGTVPPVAEMTRVISGAVTPETTAEESGPTGDPWDGPHPELTNAWSKE